MKDFWPIKNPKARFAVVLGAAMAFGNMISRVATENLGFAAGLVIGTAATAILALGFSLILNAMAESTR